MSWRHLLLDLIVTIYVGESWNLECFHKETHNMSWVGTLAAANFGETMKLREALDEIR